MFGEDDQLLARELGIGNDLAQLVELRLVPRIVDALGEVAELLDLLPFGLQIGERGGDDAFQQLVLGDFVLLPAVLGLSSSAVLLSRTSSSSVIRAGASAVAPW